MFEYDKRSYILGDVSPLGLLARYFLEVSPYHPSIFLAKFLIGDVDRLLVYLIYMNFCY